MSFAIALIYDKNEGVKMVVKPKLNLKYYVVTLLLLLIVVLAWYGIYFISANEVMMEEEPMDEGTKSLIAVLLSVIALSWSVSLATMIRQIVLGYGFIMDETGIRNTATAVMVFSLIFVIPIKRIPYSAITKLTEEDGIPTAKLNKAKLIVAPVLRPFARGEYHFFAGFIKEAPKEIGRAVKLFKCGRADKSE